MRFGSSTVIWLSVLVGISSRAFAQSPSTPAYRIAGTVVSRTDEHPLARARVTIANVKDTEKAFSVITSEDGKFEFTGVAAGKYTLAGAKRGYLTASYNQHEVFSTAIVTGVDLDAENLTLRLWPAAYIAGKVIDEVGDPVRRASVTLYRSVRRDGASHTEQVRSASTNDLGEYELGPLVAGKYYIAAQAMPWYAIHPIKNEQNSSAPPTQVDPALDVAYPVTFFADVTDADSATAIDLHGGDRMQADIHLNAVPALHLLFHVSASSGLNQGISIPQLMQSSFGSDSPVPVASVQPVRAGLWEMTGVPAGRYNIRMPGNGGGSELKQVDLVNDADEVDTSGGVAFSTVKIQVSIADEPSLPAQLFVGLRAPEGRISGAQKISSKGEAELQQVQSGQYEIFAWEPGRQFHVAQLSSSDAEVSGHLLNVPAGSTVSASVVLFSKAGNVQGFVKKNGKGFAGAMVLLVPKDPATHLDLFRRDQSDLDGSFQLNDVVPGSYTVLAIEDGWELDWQQPAVLAPYLKSGQSIEVSGRRLTTLPEPVSVKPK